jgi:hypothetical protein
MTEDASSNNFVFFHVSGAPEASLRKGIDSTRFLNRHTSRQEKGLQYGIASYYTKPDDGERMVGGDKYAVLVPKNKVYPMDTDPNGYRPVAEARFGEDTPFRGEAISREMASMAKKDGYQMAVGEWHYSRAGHEIYGPALRADALVKLIPEKTFGKYRPASKKEVPHPDKEKLLAEKAMHDVAEKIVEYKSRKGKYDSAYSIANNYRIYGEELSAADIASMKSGIPSALKNELEDAANGLKIKFSKKKAEDLGIDPRVVRHVRALKEEGASLLDIEQELRDTGHTEEQINYLVYGVGERQFTKKWQSEFGDSKSDVAKFYTKISLADTLEKAHDLISEYGEATVSAMVMDDSVSLSPNSRMAVAMALLDKWGKDEATAVAAGESATEIRNKQIALLEKVSEIATKTAQLLNVFKLWAMLSPEAAAHRIKRNHSKYQKDSEARKRKKGEKLAKAIKKIHAVAANVAMSSQPAQQILAQAPNQPQVATVRRSGRRLVSDAAYLAAKARAGKNLFTLAVPLNKDAITIAVYHLENAIISGKGFAGFAAGMVREYGAKVKKYLIDIHDVAKTQMVADGIDPAAFDTKDTINKFMEGEGLKMASRASVDLKELIKNRFVDEELSREEFVNAVLEATGLSRADSAKLVDVLETKFNDAVAKAKAKVIDSFLTKREREVIKRHQQDWEDLMNFIEYGGFDSAVFADRYAAMMKIPPLSSEQLDRIKALAGKVAAAKGEIAKTAAIEDLILFEKNLQGVMAGDLVTSVWYADMLSGYKTHAVNILANAYGTLAGFVVSALHSPTSAPYMAKGLIEGFTRGLVEAADVLRTGYSPIRGKVEVPDVLEQIARDENAGRALKALSLLRFVGRALKAADTMAYSMNKEMRAYQLAQRKAIKDGFDKVSLDTLKEISMTLANAKSMIASAKAQATAEGLSGIAHTRRAWEIMEEMRDPNIVEDSKTFGARGTWNFEPEGALGVLANGVNSISSALSYKGFSPVRYFIPFTRIIANVANDFIEYTPYGFVRAGMGHSLFKSGMETGKYSSLYREYDKEERSRKAIKATLGSLAMITLYALSDPDDGEIEITAAGTGDWKKNKELMESGWMPYSWRKRGGDTWYSYANTPLALVFAPIGFFRDQEHWNKDKFNASTVLDHMGMWLWSTMKFFNDMTFLRSVNSLMTSLGNSPDNLSTFLEKQLPKISKNFVVPAMYDQAFSDLEKVADMATRDDKGMKAAFLRHMPVLRESVLPKVNVLGEPVHDDNDRFFSDVRKDEFWDFMLEHNAFVGEINRNAVSNFVQQSDSIIRPMNDDEYLRFLADAGKKIKSRVLEIARQNGGTWESYREEYNAAETAGEKEAIIQGAIEDVIRQSRKEALANLSGLPEQK